MKNKAVTEEQVAAWSGSDASYDDLIKLLTEIVNGEYAIEDMRAEILTFEE